MMLDSRGVVVVKAGHELTGEKDHEHAHHYECERAIFDPAHHRMIQSKKLARIALELARISRLDPRHRHGARGARPDLRAVFHDKGRARARALDFRPPMASSARVKVHPGLERARSRHDLRIYLPRAEAPQQRSVNAGGEKMPEGTEHILLVEDDTSVRRLSKELLTRLGYSVTEAASGVPASHSAAMIRGTSIWPCAMSFLVMSGPQWPRRSVRFVPPFVSLTCRATRMRLS